MKKATIFPYTADAITLFENRDDSLIHIDSVLCFKEDLHSVSQKVEGITFDMPTFEERGIDSIIVCDNLLNNPLSAFQKVIFDGVKHGLSVQIAPYLYTQLHQSGLLDEVPPQSKISTISLEEFCLGEQLIAVRYRHNNDAPITVCTRDFLGTNFSVSYNRSELARLTGVDTLPSNSFAVPVIAAEIINGYFQFSSLSASDIIRILMKINKYPHCDSSYSSSPIYESERPLIIKISSKKIIQHIPRIIKVLKHKYDLEAICLTPKTNDIAHQFYCVPKKDIDTFFTNKLYAHIRSDILFIIEMEYEKYDIEINLQASTVFFTIAEGLYKHHVFFSDTRY